MSATTATVLIRYGAMRAISRLIDGQKVLAFPPTMPPPIGPRPGPGPAWMRSVSLSSVAASSAEVGLADRSAVVLMLLPLR